MSLVPRLKLVSAAVAATATLAACGGSSKTPDPAEPVGGSPAAAAPSNAQDRARVKLTQCLRQQGIDFPDTDTTGEAFAQMSPAERKRAQAALQGPCQQYASEAFGDAADPQSPEMLDTLTSFTVCLRKHGVDVPDPDPSNPFSVLHSLDKSDPKIAGALPACQDKLAALNGGG